MIVMRTCSLIENGPGLSDTPKILTLGTTRAHTRMMGKDTNCATIYNAGTRFRTTFREQMMERLTPVIVTDGNRKKKNWLRPGIRIAQQIPMNHARNVAHGMSGSSVLATAERTSGYGESSSNQSNTCQVKFAPAYLYHSSCLPRNSASAVKLGSSKSAMAVTTSAGPQTQRSVVKSNSELLVKLTLGLLMLLSVHFLLEGGGTCGHGGDEVNRGWTWSSDEEYIDKWPGSDGVCLRKKNLQNHRKWDSAEMRTCLSASGKGEIAWPPAVQNTSRGRHQ